MDIALRTFNFLLQDDKLRVPSLESPQMQPWGLLYDSLTNSDNPQVQMAHFREQAALYDWRTEKAKLLPELKLGYYNQSLIGPQQINGREQYFGADKRFHYFSAGIGIPLMFKPVQARIAAAKIDWERAKAESAYTVQSNELARSHAAATLRKLQSSVAYYQSKALKNAEAIWRIADDQFRAGAIDYLQWVVHLDQALSIKTEYLHTLADYNTALIEFLLLTNQ
jgi:cobalt-zinc-cadmium resistance protein CzcA